MPSSVQILESNASLYLNPTRLFTGIQCTSLLQLQDREPPVEASPKLGETLMLVPDAHRELYPGAYGTSGYDMLFGMSTTEKIGHYRIQGIREAENRRLR